MGKIINILGPHGVGKTTLQNFINSIDKDLVFEGFIIPPKKLDLSDEKDYILYQRKYLKRINKQNNKIVKSSKNGYVIRSIEEIEYYLKCKNINEETINSVIKHGIKSNFLIYLDADKEILRNRISNDSIRDQVETSNWYKNDYDKYDNFFKKYHNVIIIDTSNKSIEEIYKIINSLI